MAARGRFPCRMHARSVQQPRCTAPRRINEIVNKRYGLLWFTSFHCACTSACSRGEVAAERQPVFQSGRKYRLGLLVEVNFVNFFSFPSLFFSFIFYFGFVILLCFVGSLVFEYFLQILSNVHAIQRFWSKALRLMVDASPLIYYKCSYS